jgi:hypothetical protein
MAHSNRQAIFANSTIMLEKTTANKGSIITSRAKRCRCGVFCSSPHLAGQALARRLHWLCFAASPHQHKDDDHAYQGHQRQARGRTEMVNQTPHASSSDFEDNRSDPANIRNSAAKTTSALGQNEASSLTALRLCARSTSLRSWCLA